VTSALGSSADKKADRDWPVYGGTPENNHFSPLEQINRKNVKDLQVAWTFDTEETGGLQTSPIEVNGVLYGITPTQKIFAVDAATGKLLWKFDSEIKGTQPDRGLSYWSDGKESRIIAGVMNFVYALDAATGKPIPTFGRDGRIDLREDLARNPAEQVIYLTSPAVIYKDLMIVGGRESETLPASTAKIFCAGVMPYRTPFTSTGLVCKPPASSVSNVQATCKCFTFLRLICLSGEK
jgi:quinoprotein glucose dehydrogenase